MNDVCIGGCWHGSQLLQSHKSNYFVVKDKISKQTILYKRFFMWFAEEKHTFWVADSLGYVEAKESIMCYLKQIE